jgi:peptidoglycan/LPS O-acetylase OafA/YrhL
VGQVWSIGVEEQFYLLWPWLAKKSRHFLRTLLLLFIGVLLVKILILALSLKFPESRPLQILRVFLAMSKIECMAIGAAGGYFLFVDDKRVLKIVFNPIAQLFSFILIPFLIFFTPPVLQDGVHIVYSVLFIIIILNVASNRNSFLKLENRVFNMLGSISYGIYMYHMFVVVLVVRLFHQWFREAGELTLDCCYYIFSLALTILISWVSFRFFEKPISDKRKRFSAIFSGLQAKELQ